ncbi:hypothetical protein Esti_003808 [Eimeria stiedai]
MQRLAHLFRSSSAKKNGVRVSSLFTLIRSFCAALPAPARRHPRQQIISSRHFSLLGFDDRQSQFKQTRSNETNRHVREGVSQRQPGDKPVGLLKGAPTFTPKKTDLQQNFLEVDPDNPTRLLEYFAHLLKHGNLEPSEAQKDLMKEMQVLMDAIEAENFKTRGAAFESDASSVPAEMHQEDSSQPQLALHLSQIDQVHQSYKSHCLLGARTEPKKTERAAAVLNPRIRGMYIYGGVGQGKTMILDAFFDCLSLKRKLRVHFHQFMLDVQQELHRIKVEQPDVENPLFEVARKISKKAQVLCFDEFQVVHITDAMIMKRLFEGLFSLGAIVVATSNRAPQELYVGGLNRERFLSFIPLLERCCKVYHIDTKKDYRLAKGGVSCRSLFYAPPRQEKVIFEELKRAAGGPLESGEIPGPLMQGGFAAFTFAELCGANLGPSDYLALASRFHTVSLRNIPDLHQMDQHPNEIRRFISLIDVLYERTIRVVFDAEAPIFRLLGVPDSVKLMETLRQALRAKFSRLTEAFEALGRDCKEADMYTAEEWVAAAPRVLGLSPATAEALFQLMTNDATTVLTPNRIRSLLFFHLACYDFNAPTTADLFLFSSEEEATAVLREPATYGLNNANVESSGAQDNQFAFIRTVSRIRDMTSLPYLLAHQKTHKLNDVALMGIHSK